MRLFSHHDRLYLTGGARHGREGDHDDDSSASHANAKRGAGIFIPHFHKFFGLLALFNIILYITPLYDWAVSHLGTQKLMWLSCVHVVLALSSFEFRVGRQRNGLYTIYKEMQLHTITFTLRSWSVMVGAWVFGVENILLRASYLLAWHLVADYITANYQPPSKETTIRRSVDGKSGYQHHGPVVHVALFVFSFSQLVGIFMMMIDTENAVRNAMFVMAPVQISAFLATLVRKGYFSSQVSFVTYFMSLMPIFVFHPWSALEIACVILIAVARFKLRISKYVIWVTVAVLFSWLSGDLEKVVPMDVVPFTVAAPSLPETLTSRGLPLSTMTSHAFSALAPSNLSVF